MRKSFFVLSFLVTNMLFSQVSNLKLFSEDIKSACPSVIYDFLERYLAEIQAATPGVELNRKMEDDKVIVLGGSLRNINKLNSALPFNISKMEDKYYEVSWNDSNGNVLLDLLFPIQYELLLGKSKNEIEKDLRDMINGSQEVPQDTVKLDLEPIDGGVFRTVPSVCYYVPSVTTAKYYQISASGDYYPVYCDSLKWFSLSNLLLGCISGNENRLLHVKQNMYGYKNASYTTTLGKWLNYCRQNKMQLYFAVEEEREDGIWGLLIAQSKDLGFNHILSIVVSNDFINKPNSAIKATLNAFIPTQNVKGLYQQYKNNKKHNVKYEN